MILVRSLYKHSLPVTIFESVVFPFYIEVDPQSIFMSIKIP